MDRRADRLVAAVSIALAAGFLCAAALAAFLPPTARAGLWLPLHLALAGAATTAIAGIMPYFSAALTMSQPVGARIRWASLAAVTTGTIVLAFGFTDGARVPAVAGGLTFIAGIALVGVATVRPAARALGPRGGVVILGYASALVLVAVGALLAVLFLTGWPPVLESWARLRLAHASLNLVGFVSLVIATTLLHLFPTVVGARIRRAPSAHVTVVGIAAGAALLALGHGAGSSGLLRLGAGATVLGGAGLATYALGAWRGRAEWQTDHAWHLFAMGGLASAIAWFVLGLIVNGLRVMVSGADPAASTADALVGPLVLGWTGLAILASASHLIPSIGPGGPAAHARQRRLLGRGAAARLLAANLGTAALSLGLPLRLWLFEAIGLLLVAASLLGTVALVAAAAVVGIGDARRAGPAPDRRD